MAKRTEYHKTVADAIIAFAGAGQKRRLFRILDILTVEWVTGDIPEAFRFLLNTQLIFLKKDKYPTANMFDEEAWIRSLTEAQEIAADIPEECTAHDGVKLTPKRSVPSRWWSFCSALSEGEIAALTAAMRQLGVGTQGGAEALAIFHQLIFALAR